MARTDLKRLPPWVRSIVPAVLALAGARAADLLVTFRLDPALAGEQNLLHVALGAGFLTLVAVNAAVVAGLALLVARSARAARRIPAPPPGLTFQAFLSESFFGRSRAWWCILYRNPDRDRARWLLGRLAVALTLSVSAFAVAGNLGSYTHMGFAALWADLVGGPARFLLTLAAWTALSLAAWLRVEYALYRRARPVPRFVRVKVAA